MRLFTIGVGHVFVIFVSPQSAMKPRPTQLTMIAGVALATFGAGCLGWLMAGKTVASYPIWPPSGLAVGIMLLLGYEVWPGVLLGCFLAALARPGLAAFPVQLG